MLRDVEVFWVVEIRVETVLNTVDDSRLEINEESSWNVMLIISLVEEDVLSVLSISRIVFQYTFWVDSMFLAKVLPEFISNCENFNS
jgi:hypothetical protein